MSTGSTQSNLASKQALTVVGSIAIDAIKTPFGEINEGLGGSATFFSAAAGLLCPVHVVAVLGEDFDLQDLAFLRERGVNLDGVEQRPGKTFRWKGAYGQDMNEAQTLATELNVFQDFNPKLAQHHLNSPFLFLANIQPQLQLAVLEQVKEARFVAADTMNLWINTARETLLEVLARVDLLVINETETRLLADESNTVQAAKIVQSLGPKTVIVKRGEFGSLMLDGDTFFMAPAYPVNQVLDPTGAGDTFAGGLMGTIARAGHVDAEVLRRGIITGTTLASFTVERFSVERLKTLTLDEVQQRYAHMQALTHFPPLAL